MYFHPPLWFWSSFESSSGRSGGGGDRASDRLRRRAVASLGELLFYIATQVLLPLTLSLMLSLSLLLLLPLPLCIAIVLMFYIAVTFLTAADTVYSCSDGEHDV